MLMRVLFDSSVLYSFSPPQREFRFYESGRPTSRRKDEVPYTSQVSQCDDCLCKLSLVDLGTRWHKSRFPSLKRLSA